MDPITAAILGSIASGAAGSATSAGFNAVGKAYIKLKDYLTDNLGAEHELVLAVGQLEKKPDSEARRKMVAEEVEASAAGKSMQIIDLANALLEELKGIPAARSYVRQTAIGDNIAQADRGGTASVTINSPNQKN